ncbi:MFS transporter [Paenibacillus sp. P96]|uniref:MFS transporter n=1 Tax=Paenibacillus zeirhizosphaerae TaxID=2987519 RepID=A0ABT9FV33_9BACL|nr:MFS transporter [Paenibacillus sp. P96]MDP4098322.1 MFS transporter [Paenibacillus sp. P96]
MNFIMKSLRFAREEKEYTKLFTAGVVNGIGDRFFQVALLAMMIRLTGSGLGVGIVLGLRMLPFLLLAPLGGWLADRFSRRTLMIWTDMLRALIALSFFGVSGPEQLWIVYSSSFLLACGEAMYAPVRKSAIPVLVAPHRLLTVNSLEQLMTGVVLIAGSAVGGVIAVLFGSGWSFVINAVSFVLAGLIVRSIVFPSMGSSARRSETSQAEAQHSLEMERERRTPLLRTLLAGSAALQAALLLELLVPVFNGIDNVLISVYPVEEFGTGEEGVGLFYGALGLGLLLGPLLAQYVRERSLIGVGLLCLFLEGLLLILLSRMDHLWFAAVVYVVISLVGGVGNICVDTMIMRETPSRLQGRVFGLTTAWSGSMLGISMFGAGLALEVIEPRRLGWYGGAGFVVTAMLITLIYSMIRRKVRA